MIDPPATSRQSKKYRQKNNQTEYFFLHQRISFFFCFLYSIMFSFIKTLLINKQRKICYSLLVKKITCKLNCRPSNFTYYIFKKRLIDKVDPIDPIKIPKTASSRLICQVKVPGSIRL